MTLSDDTPGGLGGFTKKREWRMAKANGEWRMASRDTGRPWTRQRMAGEFATRHSIFDIRAPLDFRVAVRDVSRRSATIGERSVLHPDRAVDVKMARLLDLYVDGITNPNADTVRYTAPSRDSTVLLSYRVFLRHVPAC